MRELYDDRSLKPRGPTVPTVRDDETLTFKIALGLICVSGVLVPLQMSPGWAMVELDIPPWWYYAFMAVCWGVGCGLIQRNYRVPAILGGVVAGVGCLAAITTVLAYSTWTHSLILMVTGALGAAPGGLLYLALAWVQDRIWPPPAEAVQGPTVREGASAAPDANEALPDGRASDGIRPG
jgi:hypothetical protein